MNLSSLTGVIAALIVFFGALATSTDDYKIFLDVHAILIVVGGTIAASLICFPMQTLFMLVRVVFLRVLGKSQPKHRQVIEEAVLLAKGHRTDDDFLKNQMGQIKNDFLKEAIALMVQGGIPADDQDEILEKRAEVISRRHEKEAMIFKTIGKFPPAFGLMGTTLGMVALLQKLGGADSYKSLGPAMAIGLVATLYGIALTNLVLIPIGEHLQKLNEEDDIARDIVINAVQLLRRREHPILIEQHLLSYLLPKERNTYTSKAA